VDFEFSSVVLQVYGILTPILKKGKDKNIPGNYRGIVVTNTFSKILALPVVGVIGIFVLVEVDIM
jgi:hypothetical protein